MVLTDHRRARLRRAPTLWSVWLEELGGKPPHPRLSKKRCSYLERLAREQIRRRRNDHGALELMRNICRAVKRSDHHMSHRSFQLPESLFVNAERRERWALVSRPVIVSYRERTTSGRGG
jgi:hypothetical protein